MFCGNCGKEVSDNMQFCPKCGAPVSSTKRKEAGKIPPKRHRKWSVILSCSLIITLGAGALGSAYWIRKASVGSKKDSVTFGEDVVLPYPVRDGDTVVWGLVNGNGKEILAPQYDDISDDVLETRGNGYYIVNKDDKKGVIDYEGNELLEPIYEDIRPWVGNPDALAVIQEGKKMGLYNVKMKKMIFPIEYDRIYSNFYVSLDGFDDKWICLKPEDTDEEWVGNIETGEIIGEGYGGYCGFEPNADLVMVHRYGEYGNRECGCIDTAGEEVLPFCNEITPFSKDGYAGIIVDGQVGVIDRIGCFCAKMDEGYELIKGSYEDGNGNTFAVKNTEGWGIINFKGTEKVPCQYDEYIGSFEDGKLFIFQDDDLYGCVDSNGEIVIPFECDNLVMSQVYPGVAVVEKDGKWSIIDLKGKGKQEISIDMDSVAPFDKNGIAVFEDREEMYGIINAKGEELTESRSELLRVTGTTNGCYDAIRGLDIDTAQYYPKSSKLKIKNGDGVQIKDTDGKILLSDKDGQLLKLYGNYALIEKNEIYYYMDLDSKRTMELKWNLDDYR